MEGNSGNGSPEFSQNTNSLIPQDRAASDRRASAYCRLLVTGSSRRPIWPACGRIVAVINNGKLWSFTGSTPTRSVNVCPDILSFIGILLIEQLLRKRHLQAPYGTSHTFDITMPYVPVLTAHCPKMIPPRKPALRLLDPTSAPCV